MLLDDKITALLLNEYATKSKLNSIFIKEIESKGIVSTLNYNIIDILYYLLNQDFPHDNINFQLYIRIEQLLNLYTTSVEATEVDYIETVVDDVIENVVINLPSLELDFGSVVIGDEKILSFTFEASRIFNSIVLSTSQEFLLSTDMSLPFTDSLLFLPKWDTGEVTTTTVYVKYYPLNTGSDNVDLIVEVENVGQKEIVLTGTGINSILSVFPLSIVFPGTSINTDSTVYNFTITGSSLISAVSIIAPNGFLVSTDNVTYNSIITLSNVSTLNQLIYVKFHPSAHINYNSNIIVSNLEVTPINIAVSGTVLTASISISENSLNLGSTPVNETSVSKYIVISGTSLEGNINIDCTGTVFKVSLDNTNFYTSVDIVPVNNTVTNVNVYFNFSPLDVTSYDEIIDIISNSASIKTVELMGVGVVTQVGIDPDVFNFDDTNINYNSSSIPFNIVALNLFNNLTIIAPTGFEISDDDITWHTELVLIPVGEIVNENLYCRFSPTIEQSYLSQFIIDIEVQQFNLGTLTGDGVIAILNRIPTTHDFDTVFIGDYADTTFTLSGTNLIDDVTITPITGYTVSLNGVDFYSSIDVPKVIAEAGVTVYVRFTPTLEQSYNGNIVLSTTQAISTTFGVTGIGEIELVSQHITLINTEPNDGFTTYPFTVDLIQLFTNYTDTYNSGLYRIDYISLAFGGPLGGNALITVYNVTTETTLYTKNYVGTGSGGSKNISPTSPVLVSPGDVIAITVTRQTGSGWFGNNSIGTPNPYQNNVIADGITKTHYPGLVVQGDIYI